jgi:CIC family chloride channel protein
MSVLSTKSKLSVKTDHHLGDFTTNPRVLMIAGIAVIVATAGVLAGLALLTSGGVLAPLLIMGGAMGTALSGYLPSASPGFCALLAMAATMGGTMRSPLTATFFAVELTGNPHVLCR